jgi:hypothetical protein
MANEVTLTASLSVFKSSVMSAAKGVSVTGMTDNMAGSCISDGSILVATSATAIPLGSITSCGWCALHNTDSTNYVTLQNGGGGTPTVYVGPGKYAFFTLPPTAVPYLLANTAACYVEFFIASA